MNFKQTISDGWTAEIVGHEVSIRDAAGQYWGNHPAGCTNCATGQRFPVGSPEEQSFSAKLDEARALRTARIEQAEQAAHAKLMAPMSKAERIEESLTASMDREDSIH